MRACLALVRANSHVAGLGRERGTLHVVEGCLRRGPIREDLTCGHVRDAHGALHVLGGEREHLALRMEIDSRHGGCQVEVLLDGRRPRATQDVLRAIDVDSACAWAKRAGGVVGGMGTGSARVA